MTYPLPKVSILMGAYNASQYVRSAIDSVISQTFPHWELLIINDCSTDETRAIIQSYHDPRLHLLENRQNLGLTKSLNIALGQAQGEYIARLDTDDISLPERLTTQVHFLESHPEIALVGSLAKLIDSK